MMGVIGALAVINTHPKNKMMIIAPLTILSYISLASKQGILIKDGRSLELLRQVDTVVFDKTGTLTEEQPHVGLIHCCAGYSENKILSYAAAAEYKQNHPLAKAIRQEAENRQLTVPVLEESEYQMGYGFAVKIAGQSVHVGSGRFLIKEDITIPPDIKQQQVFSHDQGQTLVMVAVDKHIIGAIELIPTIRSEIKAVISRLKQHPNIKATYIISGDHEIPTKKMAEELGIDHYFAEILPEKKADIIEQLQQQGHSVCYVGDGINDSIALKKAKVSVSMSGASTVATDTANIILMNKGLSHLISLFDLADKFNVTMNAGFTMILIPSLMGLGGVFLLGFGIIATVWLNLFGLAIGVGTATLPLLTQQPAEEPPKTDIPAHSAV
jgi:Cu2+-exporting ATPase